MSEPVRTTPLGAVEKMLPVTIAHLALAGLFAAAIILMLWWGTHLRRQRRRVEHELEERGELEYVSEDAPVVPISEPAPATAEPTEQAAPAESTSTKDDLTQMKGVGPRLAERLNSVGITSFAQLAALGPDEATALDARLGDFRGRLERDRWIEQARLLAGGDTVGFEEKFGKL